MCTNESYVTTILAKHRNKERGERDTNIEVSQKLRDAENTPYACDCETAA